MNQFKSSFFIRMLGNSFQKLSSHAAFPQNPDRFDKTSAPNKGISCKILDTTLFQGFLATRTRKVALRPFAGEFSSAPHGLGLFSSTFFRGFFVGGAELHLSEDTFALKLFLENLEGLVDVIVSYDNIHY